MGRVGGWVDGWVWRRGGHISRFSIAQVKRKIMPRTVRMRQPIAAAVAKAVAVAVAVAIVLVVTLDVWVTTR